MPSYNAGIYIGRAIESILRQTYSDWELIIVDDCSCDNTVEVVKRYMSQSNKIRLIQREKNSGGARLPRYQGILQANGELVSHIDSDDFVEDRYLEKMLYRLRESSADIVLSFLNYCGKNEEEDNRTIPRLPFDFNKIITGREACIETLNGWNINLAGLLLSTTRYKAFVHSEITVDCMSCFNDELDYRKLILGMNSVAFSSAKYYYRQQNESVLHISRSHYVDRVNQITPLYQWVISNFAKDLDVIDSISQDYINSLYVALSVLILDKHKIGKREYKTHINRIQVSLSFYKKSHHRVRNYKYKLLSSSFIILYSMSWLRSIYVLFKSYQYI